MRKASFILVLVGLCMVSLVSAQESYVCNIYFTKIGCPVCSQTDPIILGEWINKYNNLVIIEYLVDEYENNVVMGKYKIKYGLGGGVPTLMFDGEDYMSGVYHPHYGGLERWKQEMEEKIENFENNNCLLLENSVSFGELDLNTLQGKPKIWANGRVLIKNDSYWILKCNEEFDFQPKNITSEIDYNDFLKETLFSDNPQDVLEISSFKITEIEAVSEPISYGEINFKKSFKIESKENNNQPPVNNSDIDGEKNSNNSLPFIYISVFIILIVIILYFAQRYKK